MLFGRRQRQGYGERFKLWLWPRVSWRRSALYYLKRVLRLSGTPHAIAMGAAIGAAVSFTPLMGFHLVATFALAWLFRANMIAGGIGTAIGNPLTFPFIWASTYELGHLMLKGASRDAPAQLGDYLMHRSFEQLLPLIKPMAVGAIPLGLAAGGIVYLIAYKAISSYQEGRRRRLAGVREKEVGDPAMAEIGRPQ